MNQIIELFGKFVNEVGQSKTSGLGSTAKKFYEEIRKTKEILIDPTDLEEVLRSSQTKKEKKRDVLLSFYQFYEQETGRKVESDLSKKTIIDNSQERQIAVIKYMQSHKWKTSEICDQFMMSDKMMNGLLNELEQGIQILDTDFKVPMEREGWSRYVESSSHPVLLNLTIPEVIAMTIGLMDAAKKDPLYAAQFKKIAKDVYGHLTEYGKNRIGRLIRDRQLEEFFDEEMSAYEHQLSNALITMLKSGCKGTIEISDGDTYHTFESCYVIEYNDGAIKIKTKDNQEKLFQVKDVFRCTYYLKREFD